MKSLSKDDNPQFAKRFYLLLTVSVTGAFAIAVSLVIAGLIALFSYE